MPHDKKDSVLTKGFLFLAWVQRYEGALKDIQGCVRLRVFEHRTALALSPILSNLCAFFCAIATSPLDLSSPWPWHASHGTPQLHSTQCLHSVHLNGTGSGAVIDLLRIHGACAG